MARQFDNRQRLQLLGISVILLLGLPAVINPAPSSASGTCAPIVRKYNNGTFYKARVSIVQGQPSCAEARDLLWAGMRWTLVVNRDGWECHPRNLETVFQGQKCTRDEPGGERQAIQSSVPRPCPKCTGTRK